MTDEIEELIYACYEDIGDDAVARYNRLLDYCRGFDNNAGESDVVTYLKNYKALHDAAATVAPSSEDMPDE